ncbi:MAG: aminotransferase class V-fold PLP-dependent enzyme [Pseudomonadota bacterium]
MTDSTLDALLRQHFSCGTLDSDPAPLQRALAMLRDWLAPAGKPAYPPTPFAELTETFDDYAMPAHGIGVDAFLGELQQRVLAHTAHLNHPRYLGHMTQALPWATIMAETFTAALNQNQVKIETAYASTLVEKQLLGWMHRKVYQCDDAYYAQAMRSRNQAIGNLVNGGTMGNLTALAVALERQLPGTRREGLCAALAKSGHRGLAVVGSARVHYSLKKAMATLGLGENALHTIPVDRDNRIDMHALQARLDELRAAGIKLLALVGIAGTTETGAIDPLAQLAALARREGAWFHVDAAWGGALLVADQFRHLYDGVEQADSVVIDGHKLLWVPMAQSLVVFRDSASLDCLKHHANYIIRNNSGDLGQTSLEGSRRFDALKLWAAFKILGVSGYATLLSRAASLAATMRELIRDDEDFELTSDSSTFILTYRYAPAGLRDVMAQLVATGATGDAVALNLQLNALNAALQERQKANGNSFVSRTLLERSPYPDGITVLRVVLTNVTTTEGDLRAVLAEQQVLGRTLMSELGLERALA